MNQNAGKYKTELIECNKILIELLDVKIKVAGLGLYDCYRLLDKAENKLQKYYNKLDEAK